MPLPKWLTGMNSAASRLSGMTLTSTLSWPIHVAVNALRLRSSQPLWLAISIGKHRLGQPLRSSAISDIHARLIGAGVICGALSRVMNPISGRAGLLDSSLIRSSIRWGHPSCVGGSRGDAHTSKQEHDRPTGAGPPLTFSFVVITID